MGSLYQVDDAGNIVGNSLSVTTSVAGNTVGTNGISTQVTLSGNSVVASGTAADVDVNLTPKGSGSVVMPKIGLPGGAISNAMLANAAVANLSGTNTGDQTITLTSDVTGTGNGSFATTIVNNAVTYAKMQAVSTTSRLLGSSSTTTPVQEVSLGSGLSLSGTTLSAPIGANGQFIPADPVSTISTVGVMMGLGATATFTPTKSGNILIVVSGDVSNDTPGDGSQIQIITGTGTAPSNGDALTGAAGGSLINILNDSATTPGKNAWSCNAVVTGLAVGTAIWIDVSLAAVTGGTSEIGDVSISIIEQ